MQNITALVGGISLVGWQHLYSIHLSLVFSRQPDSIPNHVCRQTDRQTDRQAGRQAGTTTHIAKSFMSRVLRSVSKLKDVQTP